jgi:hypothetical protein
VLFCLTNSPIITVNGPGTVRLSTPEINGGQYFAGNYNGTSPLGITATNVSLVMDTVDEPDLQLFRHAARRFHCGDQCFCSAT